MSDDNKNVKFRLLVKIDTEQNKVLYAVSSNQLADILLSFLTLPLGRIIKILEKHYGDDEGPTIGSLSSLYHGLANLGSSHFVTEGAKKTLLNPTSSLEDEYPRLKLDITESPPAEYFYCSNCSQRFRSVSIYYDQLSYCHICRDYSIMREEVAHKNSADASISGVFAKRKTYFVIYDDLLILPYEPELIRIIDFLGTTDTDNVMSVRLDFGLSEIMNLLKASLTSPTPLSDVILDKAVRTDSAIVVSQPKISLPQNAKEENPSSRNFILKVIIQKSRGKILYAQAKEDFIEFLFSLLFIPLGGVEHLLAGKIGIKAINNLHRSTAALLDAEYLKTADTKSRLITPKIPHGCISKNHILPLTEECLPSAYWDPSLFSSDKFPKGQGSYLQEPQTYQVKNDLTVTPFCIVSILSSLKEQKIPLSDVKEMEVQIGLKEALSILKASLTSTCALTDALLNHKSNKQPKSEV